MPTKGERTTFSTNIVSLARQLKLSYIDAITHYCEEKGLEVEVAAKLVNEDLKRKIAIEAKHMRMLS